MTNPPPGTYRVLTRNRAGVATTYHTCPHCGHTFKDRVLPWAVVTPPMTITSACPKCEVVDAYRKADQN